EIIAIGVRWATFVCLAIPLGACGFAIARRRAALAGSRPHTGSGDPVEARTGEMPDEYADATRGAARLALVASLALLLLYAVRLVEQVASLEDPDTPWRELAELLLRHTAWGTGWLVAVGAILLAAGIWWRAASRGRTGVVAMLGTLPLASVPALSGHAVGDPDVPALAVALDWLHVLGFGFWLGTLLMIVLLVLPRRARVLPLIKAFSPMALLSAGVIVLSGVAGAWLHLGAVDALWTSSYGRVLLVKVAVVLLVAGAGGWNWKRVTPRLGGDMVNDSRMLGASARLELLLGALVLLATAVLVATPLPGE
ncbi:MAG TPA: CopD family protein, partial [Gemmatimonadaceae bacterium]|nr:CopD family protein [Gemmatimonadaceae bacterium]